MNNTSHTPVNMELTVEMRLHNLVFKCPLCNEWKNAKKTKCYGISTIAGFQPVQKQIQTPGQQEMQILMSGVVVCEKCFNSEQLELEDQPPQIVVPHVVPPADIRRKN